MKRVGSGSSPSLPVAKDEAPSFIHSPRPHLAIATPRWSKQAADSRGVGHIEIGLLLRTSELMNRG